jgi:hypothetical protein
MIVLRRCPTWKLFAILGEEYSMTTFLPLPDVLAPYWELGTGVRVGSEVEDWVKSCTCVRMLRIRVGVVSWKWRNALSCTTDAT